MATFTGNIRGNAKQLAKYLLDQAENDVPPVLLDTRGLLSSDIRLGLMDMAFQAERAGSDKAFFNFQFNPRPEEAARMTKQDVLRVAAIMETHLGLDGQMRVIVEHQKSGRRHWHMVWPTFDEKAEKLASSSFYKYKLTNAREEVEIELGLARTQRFNRDHKGVREELTAIFRQADPLKAAGPSGWIICKGAQGKPYVAIHEDKGRSFVLADHVNLPFAQVLDYLKGQKLPTDKAVIKQIRSRQLFNDKQEAFVEKIAQAKPRIRVTAEQQVTQNQVPRKEEREAGNDPIVKKPQGPIMAQNLTEEAPSVNDMISAKQEEFSASIETFKEQQRFKEKAGLFAQDREEMLNDQRPEPAPEPDNVISFADQIAAMRKRQQQRGHQR